MEDGLYSHQLLDVMQEIRQKGQACVELRVTSIHVENHHAFDDIAKEQDADKIWAWESNINPRKAQKENCTCSGTF